MKRIAIFALVMLGFTLSSCRCSEPPPIGPVEDEEAAAASLRPAVSRAPIVSLAV